MRDLKSNAVIAYSLCQGAMVGATNGTGVSTRGYNGRIIAWAIVKLGATQNSSHNFAFSVQDSANNSDFAALDTAVTLADASAVAYASGSDGDVVTLTGAVQIANPTNRYLRIVTTMTGTGDLDAVGAGFILDQATYNPVTQS